MTKLFRKVDIEGGAGVPCAALPLPRAVGIRKPVTDAKSGRVR